MKKAGLDVDRGAKIEDTTYCASPAILNISLQLTSCNTGCTAGRSLFEPLSSSTLIY